MSVIKVAILGYGTVGEGIYQTIKTHRHELKKALGAEVDVVAVLIQNKQKERNIDKEVLVTADYKEVLKLPQLDVVFEAIVGKEPSFSYLKDALSIGCHIVTANKEMFAEHGQELIGIADKRGKRIGFEATVAGGVPIIQTLQQLLKINNPEAIQGILNGTSNFILTEMRDKHQSFEEALALAQEKGFAEADPGNDVYGFDALFKSKILSQVAFGEQPEQASFQVTGISGVTAELVEIAERLGLRFKHIAEIKRKGGKLQGSIQPVLVSPSHPFYHVEGVENAVNVKTDLIGSLTLQGPGAGMLPTASAMVEDLVHIWQHPLQKIGNPTKKSSRENQEQEECCAYWLLYNINDKSLLRRFGWHREYAKSIYVVRAKESELGAIQTMYEEFQVYPILADSIFGRELEKENILVQSS